MTLTLRISELTLTLRLILGVRPNHPYQIQKWTDKALIRDLAFKPKRMKK